MDIATLKQDENIDERLVNILRTIHEKIISLNQQYEKKNALFTLDGEQIQDSRKVFEFVGSIQKIRGVLANQLVAFENDRKGFETSYHNKELDESLKKEMNIYENISVIIRTMITDLNAYGDDLKIFSQYIGPGDSRKQIEGSKIKEVYDKMTDEYNDLKKKGELLESLIKLLENNATTK